MFNLSDILQNAQGGRAAENLAQQYGLSAGETQNALQALIPTLSSALQNRANDPEAMGQVISAVADRDHREAFHNPDAATDPETVQKGQDVLGGLFGSNQATGQITQQVSKVTGLPPDVIAKLFPVVASIALGGMAQALHNQGLGGLLGQLAGTAQQGNLGAAPGGQPQPQQQADPQMPGGGLMGIVTTILGGLLGGGRAPEGLATQPGMDALTKLFEPGQVGASNFDQNDLQSAIGQILGGKH